MVKFSFFSRSDVLFLRSAITSTGRSKSLHIHHQDKGSHVPVKRLATLVAVLRDRASDRNQCGMRPTG